VLDRKKWVLEVDERPCWNECENLKKYEWELDLDKPCFLVESKRGEIRGKFEEENLEAKEGVRGYGDDSGTSGVVLTRKSRLQEGREVRKQEFRDSAQIDGRTR